MTNVVFSSSWYYVEWIVDSLAILFFSFLILCACACVCVCDGKREEEKDSAIVCFATATTTTTRAPRHIPFFRYTFWKSGGLVKIFILLLFSPFFSINVRAILIFGKEVYRGREEKNKRRWRDFCSASSLSGCTRILPRCARVCARQSFWSCQVLVPRVSTHSSSSAGFFFLLSESFWRFLLYLV